MRKTSAGPVSPPPSDSIKLVALEALEGRVDLADVEGPHLAGARLELLAQLQAVLRAVAQERQQTRAGRSLPGASEIASYHTQYPTPLRR